MQIINLFRMDETNAGDWHSPPCRYFPELGEVCAEVTAKTLPKERSIIVMGGGGLISPKQGFQRIRRFLGKHYCVGWGLGENWHDEKNLGYFPPSEITFPDYLNEFEMLGIRDASDKFRQVPCASCMHPAFDESYVIERRIGYYLHKRIPLALQGNVAASNDGAGIEDKIRFLGSSEVVVTNSYHGVYWAMLLNRPVICIPFGSKFYGFGETIIFQKPWEIQLDPLPEFPSYEGYLTRCRAANQLFYQDFLKNISRL